MATTITRATLTLSIATIIGTITGFAVQAITAHYFGASKEVDAFIVASIIPFVAYGFANDTFTTALIYILTKNNISTKKFSQIASSLFSILTIISTLLVLLVLVTAPQLSKILAPGFDAESLNKTTTMIRIISITMFFMSATSLTTGFLYLQNKFITPGLLRFFISTGTFLFVIILHRHYNTYSLAVGTAIGSCAAFLTQLITLTKNGFRPVLPRINYSFIKELFATSLPLWITTTFFYLNKIVNNAFASFLYEGNVAILNYANTITSFPLIISNAMATTLFPRLTTLNKNQDRFNNLLSKTIRAAFFTLLPITVILIIFRENIVSTLLQHGKFDTPATAQTTSTLAAYAIGLCALGVYPIICNALSAAGKMKQQMYLSIILIFSNTALNFIFLKYATTGLALANITAHSIILLTGFWLLMPNNHLKNLAKSLTKILVALTPSTLLLITILPFIRDFVGGIVFSIITAILYICFSHWLNVKEFEILKEIAFRWLKISRGF